MSSNNQVKRATDALINEFTYSYTVGFLEVQLARAIDLLPKTKQKEFIRSMNKAVGDVITVKVKSLLSDNVVELRWDEVGTCVDPSTERYHSM